MREELVAAIQGNRRRRTFWQLELTVSDELWPQLTIPMHELRREVRDDFRQKRIYQ